jgi:hypothetical protein
MRSNVMLGFMVQALQDPPLLYVAGSNFDYAIIQKTAMILMMGKAMPPPLLRGCNGTTARLGY